MNLEKALDSTIFERAVEARNKIIPPDKIVLRKHFPLLPAGCVVNCKFCTASTRYEKNHKGKLLDNLESSIRHFNENYPSEIGAELVANWYGLSQQDERFDRILNLISTLADDGHIVGGNLGVILDENILEQLSDAGLNYLNNNMETSTRLYPAVIGKGTERMSSKLATLYLANQIGLNITSGLLIGVGEQTDDLIEQANLFRKMPLKRVTVNLMDYETEPELAQIFSEHKTNFTTKYILKTLAFLRTNLRPDQSLMIGGGINNYFTNVDEFNQVLKIIDTIHIGTFINLKQEGVSYQRIKKRYNIGNATKYFEPTFGEILNKMEKKNEND